MSARPLGLGLDPRTTGTTGVGGIDGAGSAGGDIDLGKIVGGMGTIELLGNSRQLNVRFNAVDLVGAIDKKRDRSAQQVIDSLA